MSAPPVAIKAEILVNGTWNDVSQYVYQRDDIVITAGGQDESSQPQSSQMTLTLNNQEGVFSPNNSASPFYPHLQRNVQIRLSVTYTSSTNDYYSGYRFWGEIQDWPPSSDISTQDLYVSVTATGPMARMRRGGGRGSALARYYALLKGDYAPIAYWPCEEDPDSSIVGPGVANGQPMTVTGGTPTWKAHSSFNGSAPIGSPNRSTWTGKTGSFSSSGDVLYSTAGTYQWTCPGGITAVTVAAWGGGGGGANGYYGSGGSGGGYAQGAGIAVTPGNTYPIVVGNGGSYGSYVSPVSPEAGGPGGESSFYGDSGSVIAYGGNGGPNSTTAAAGVSGAVSGATTSAIYTSGAGGAGTLESFASSTGGNSGWSGAGGGSSAGTAANGNAGAQATGSSSPGAGGAAPSGGGAGGTGGQAQGSGTAAVGGSSPGGGGGGGGYNINNYDRQGAAGSSGQVQITYAASTTPNDNVVRWIMKVPKHGGNDGAVIIRALTSGTVARLDCVYGKGGKVQMIGYNSGGTQLFATGLQSWSLDDKTVMMEMRLYASGANVAYSFASIVPGAKSLLGSAAGTYNTASMGSVTECIVSPNGDITKTAIGHVSVQYAFIHLTRVSRALDGHNGEMSIDRFIRLLNEIAMEGKPHWAEGSDHWGFETDANMLGFVDSTFSGNSVGDWLAQTNCSIAATSAQPLGFGSSLAMTSTAAGAMTAILGNSVSVYRPVTVGSSYSVAAFFRAAVTAESCLVGIDWFDSSGTYLSNSVGTAATDSTTGWTEVTCTGTAPANAAYGTPWLEVGNTAAASEVHYVGLVYFGPNSSLGIQGWSGSNSQLCQSVASHTGEMSAAGYNVGTDPNALPRWPVEGANSLLVLCSGSAGQWEALAPFGTSGLPVVPGDHVGVSVDVYTSASALSINAGINWYDATGTYLSTSSGTSVSFGSTNSFTLDADGLAPASASYAALVVICTTSSPQGTTFMVDHARIGSRMGPQLRRELHQFMEEVKHVEEAIIHDYRNNWGMRHRTRISLINQTPAVTLDYNTKPFGDVLNPVTDNLLTKNDVTVTRRKGGRVRVTSDTGAMSTQEPPNGVGRHRHHRRTVLYDDTQIAALAEWLLNLGTKTDERYADGITINLLREEVASLMSAIASVDMGDYIQITNLPSWFPNNPAKQLVMGYTETINAFKWIITWNGQPESGWEVLVSSFRRW